MVKGMALRCVMALTCLRSWDMVWDDDCENRIEFCDNEMFEELGNGMG